MKIYLNLLPEEKKQELKKKKIFFRIIRNEVLFSVPIFAFFAILLIINLSLEMKDKEAGMNLNSSSSLKEYKELEDYEENFRKINDKISEISKMQKNHFSWIKIMDKINNNIPNDVYISDLLTNNYQISLAGRAKTRENFLKMQENFKSDSCFSDVEAPLSSLVSKENVDFQINFNVNKDCLKSH